MKRDILFFASCLVVCECFTGLLDEVVPQKDPDEDKNVTEMITSKGYPVEEYTVQTSDGYLLSLQRIPHGKIRCSGQNKKKVVLLVHALFASADTFVINFPNQSLGYILADRGHDVWLGNTRGNTYTRKHVKYTPDQEEFWNFSFTEIGLYDLPAMIDFVLEATGEDSLYYVGHSQGTTAAFALLSEIREYNEKIKLLICLGPVAFLGHLRGPFKYLAPFTNDLEYLAKLFGVKEFLSNDAQTRLFKKLFCNRLDPKVCEDLIFAIYASDKKQLNETRLPVYASHLPAGTSTKSVVHYGQLVNSKRFAKFDYQGRNVDYYQQATPPEFKLPSITAPIALLRGPSDYYANREDICILRKKLNSVVCNYRVPLDRFNHIDFIFAVDAKRLLHDKVMWLIDRY